MTLDRAFMTKKLGELQGYLGEVRDFFSLSDDEILSDRGKVHTAERLLQLVVDTVIDVNQHIIKERGLEPADDFQSTFYTLAERHILPREFAEKIAPVVGLRNRIVHRYETVDLARFIKTFRENQGDFEEYVRLVYKSIENSP